MRVRSFEETISEPGISMDETDKADRADMLSEYKYSIIVEGVDMELENLEKWIRMYIDKDAVQCFYFGKTGYDYEFREYFFNDEKHIPEVAKTVPNIYTVYPHSYPPNHTCKSDGYEKDIDYDPQNNDAIIFEP